jgi:hypothetical protein
MIGQARDKAETQRKRTQMPFKAKIVSLFLVPSVFLYAIAAGVIYRGAGASFLDVQMLKQAAIMAALCSLAQDITPRPLKEILVFWRLKDRLPGCRAFERHSADRYDLSRIVNITALRALSGADQQRVFYNRVYKKHQKDATVAGKSFRYVAWRDTAAVWFFLALLSSPVAYSLAPESFASAPALRLTAFSFAAFLLTALAARFTANDLVGQVLSCETAERPHVIDC